MNDIISADWHIRDYASAKIEEALFEALGHLVSEARKRGAKRIFCLGDVFNEKSFVHTRSTLRLKSLFERNDDLEFVLLVGNHDLSDGSQPDENCLRLVENCRNVRVVYKATYIEPYYLVPWTKTLEEDLAEGSGILLSHLGLNEAQVSSGLSIRTKVSLKDLEQYDLALLGHYHLPQQVSEKCFYVGSLQSFDWGDVNQHKRFFHLKDGQLESVEALNSLRFIELTASRETLESVSEEFRRLKAEGHFVRVSLDFVPTEEEKGLLASEAFSIASIPSRQELVTLDLAADEETRAKEYLKIRNIPESDWKQYLAALEDLRKEVQL